MFLKLDLGLDHEQQHHHQYKYLAAFVLQIYTHYFIFSSPEQLWLTHSAFLRYRWFVDSLFVTWDHVLSWAIND